MPLFEFTGDDSRFTQTSPSTFDFSGVTSVSTTSYTYLTTGGRYVTLTGYDFTIDFTGRVTDGTVTAVAISHDNTSVTNYGLTISGLSMDAVDFAGAGSDGTSAAIFDDMLDGPTTVTANDSNLLEWGFDGYSAPTGFTQGADSAVWGDSSGFYSLGYNQISGSDVFRGGDSTFRGNANEVIGDVIYANDTAVVIGGDDRMVLLQRAYPVVPA